MNWRMLATCRVEQVDPDLFFPVGVRGPAKRQIAEASTYCRRCPVQAECLQEALRVCNTMGVWAGTSERERRALRRQQAARAA